MNTNAAESFIQRSRVFPSKGNPVSPTRTFAAHDVLFEDPIGVGGFKLVRLARLRDFTEPVAVASCRAFGASDSHTMTSMAEADLKKETSLIRRLVHTNIVEVLGWCAAPFYMIMPYYIHGSLGDYLRSHTASARLGLHFMLGITDGVHFLHTKRPLVVHCDLKSSNVLIGAELQPKIADFGLSRRQHGSELLRYRCGTPG